MKMKSINKILTTVLSVSMLMGSAMPVLATEGSVDVEAPIYSLDIIDVIVPTSYAVAFNPDHLPVKTGASDTSQEQILSKNYGIINKSSKDKVITVKLNIEDQNADSGITFVDSEADVTSAAADEYKIYLAAIPADSAEVKIGTASADQNTKAADLDDVAMTKATANDTAITLKNGDNYIAFKLGKAAWTPKSGSELTLGTTTSNDVSANFEVTGLAAGGEGITAFTFSGKMSEKADWSKLTQGIKISAVYGSETASSTLTTVSGTGAMVEANVAPTFSTGKEIREINYINGVGDNGLKEIQKVELTYTNGTVYDVYHAKTNNWSAAADVDGKITLDAGVVKQFGAMGAKVDVAVVYENNAGETKTAAVKVKFANVDEAPVFTTGSGVCQINYTMGAGDEALKEIQKVELIYTNGTAYDVYHAKTNNWSAATNADGVITLDATGVVKQFGSMGAMVPVTVTYETVGGETRTASLDIKLK